MLFLAYRGLSVGMQKICQAVDIGARGTEFSKVARGVPLGVCGEAPEPVSFYI